MKSLLEFCLNEEPLTGECTYTSNDFSLSYETDKVLIKSDYNSPPLKTINTKNGFNEPTALLVIYDTLTLTFIGENKYLTAIDAYTNKLLWEITHLAKAPKVGGHGRLKAKVNLFDGDRYSIDFTPRYEITQDQALLRIILSDKRSEIHYEVANNLIIGMNKEVLTEIFISDVQFI